MTLHLHANPISMKVYDFSGPQFTLVDDNGTVYSLDLSLPPQYNDNGWPFTSILQGAVFKSGNEQIVVESILLLRSGNTFIAFTEQEAMQTYGAGDADFSTVDPTKIIKGIAPGHGEITISMTGRPDFDTSIGTISVDVAEADYRVTFKPLSRTLYPCRPFRIDFSLSIAGKQIFSTDDVNSPLCAEISPYASLSGGEGWKYAYILAGADSTCSVGTELTGLELTVAPESSDGVLKAYSPLDGASAESAVGKRQPVWPIYPNFVGLKPGRTPVQVFKEPAGPVWTTDIDILPAAVKITATNEQSLVFGEENAHLQNDSTGKYQLISDVPPLTLTVIDKNSGQPIQSFQTITLGHFVVDAEYNFIDVGRVTFENIKVWANGVLERIPYSVELLIVPASTTQAAVISFVRDPFSSTGNRDHDRVWAWIHMLVKAEAVGSATIKVTVKPDPNDPCQLSDTPTQPLGTFALPVTVVPPLRVALARYIPGGNQETDTVLDPGITIQTIYPTGKILGRIVGWSNNSKSQKLTLTLAGKLTVLIDQEKNFINPAFSWINTSTGEFQVSLSNQLALHAGLNSIQIGATKPSNQVFGGDSFQTFVVEGLLPKGTITSINDDPFADFFEIKGQVKNIETGSLLLLDPTGGGGVVNQGTISSNGTFTFKWQLAKGTPGIPGTYLARLYGKNLFTGSLILLEDKTSTRRRPKLTIQYKGKVEQNGFQVQEPPSHEQATFDIQTDDQHTTFHYDANTQSGIFNLLNGAGRLTFNLNLDASNNFKFSATNFFGQTTWEAMIERVLKIDSFFSFDPKPPWHPQDNNPVEIKAWINTNDPNDGQYTYTWTTDYQRLGNYVYNYVHYYGQPLVVALDMQGKTIDLINFGTTLTSGDVLATFSVIINYFGRAKKQSFSIYTL